MELVAPGRQVLAASSQGESGRARQERVRVGRTCPFT